MERPWWKFYGRAWLGDLELHRCSIAARGLWIAMLSLMNEGMPYGHLADKRGPIDEKALAGLERIPVSHCVRLIAELESNQVLSRTTEGVIFSRRMVRDERDRLMARARKDKFKERSECSENVDETCSGSVPNGLQNAIHASDSGSSSPGSSFSEGGVGGNQALVISQAWKDLWALDPYQTNEASSHFEFNHIMLTAVDPAGNARALVENRKAWIISCQARDIKPLGTMNWLKSGDCFKSPPPPPPPRKSKHEQMMEDIANGR